MIFNLSFVRLCIRVRFCLVFIDPGDNLTVYGDDCSVIFKGRISPDYQTGWREYPKKPGHGQQYALGFWIYWVQKGWRPDDWARLFIRHWVKRWENSKQLKAELIKKEK